MTQDAITPDAITQAQAWIEADAPVIWLLGKAQAGKTSIVAEITDQARDQIGAGFRPVTRELRVYAFPPEAPALRFLDTRGLSDDAAYDPKSDLAQADRRSHLILAVVRVTDLDLTELLATLRAARAAHPERPLLVAQTTLHEAYGRHERHVLPYPFDGSADDNHRLGVPDRLRRAMATQRRLFEGLPGRRPPLFIPLDFTRPEQSIPPADYGAERLWAALETALPEVVEQLRDRLGGHVDQAVRTKVILPWAFAAAAANALPVPVLGGLGSASLQAAMVNQIARRLGIHASRDQWAEFVAALGTGLALGFGGRWLVQQGLKLGLGWGSAIVASWTFAITWGIGEAALYYFGEKVAGREPDRAELRERYRLSVSRARAAYAARKAGAAAHDPTSASAVQSADHSANPSASYSAGGAPPPTPTQEPGPPR